MTSVLTSSASADWNTSKDVVDLAREVGGGRIALDPCSNQWSIVDAELEYRLDFGTDGLARSWVEDAEGGLVYANPPYGRALAKWGPKIAAEARAGAEILACVFAKPDTGWFRAMAPTASAVAFLPRRLRFTLHGEELDASTHPSALFYYGPSAHRFARIVERRFPGSLIHVGAWYTSTP